MEITEIISIKTIRIAKLILSLFFTFQFFTSHTPVLQYALHTVPDMLKEYLLSVRSRADKKLFNFSVQFSLNVMYPRLFYPGMPDKDSRPNRFSIICIVHNHPHKVILILQWQWRKYVRYIPLPVYLSQLWLKAGSISSLRQITPYIWCSKPEIGKISET